ncbi:MAG: ribonuclease P protein component [Bacilli bacterium]|jgi:ribonuclease P protein component|nr:ribonuclease P protein component [Bacilli bacterium]
MKKKYRIKKSQDFKKVLDGRRLAGKNDAMSVYFAPNEVGWARIGISVSTKVGNAVIRARVRRQVRAMIALTDILQKPYDIVIIAHAGFLTKTFQENQALLNPLLARLQPKTTEEKK